MQGKLMKVVPGVTTVQITDNSGITKSYPVDHEHCDVQLNGEQSSLQDIRPGDTVELSGQPATGIRVTRTNMPKDRRGEHGEMSTDQAGQRKLTPTTPADVDQSNLQAKDPGIDKARTADTAQRETSVAEEDEQEEHIPASKPPLIRPKK